MAIRIDPVVAKTSPSLFAAANAANLPPEQTKQLEQFSWAVQKNKELNQLPIQDARSKFNQLDPSVQEQLRYLYPKAEYQLQAPDASDYVVGAVKGGLKVLGSPLIGFFKAAGAWNRLINTPYLMARQAQQGEGFFNKQTFTDAWDGRRVFNQATLDEVSNQYGFEDVEVAKALIAGKKPGEIIAQLGSNPNPAILKSIEKAFNEPDKFNQVMDAVRSAQVSPGRDFGRVTGLKRLSGVIDFTYQVAIDPLTWATGGVSTLARVASKLPGLSETTATKLAMKSGTEMVKAIKANPVQGVRDVFDYNAGVRKLWDDGMGPALENYSKAVTTSEKAAAENFIKDNFPGYANTELIQKFANAGLFNAEKAKEYFVAGENVLDLIAGKTTGMQYFRNSIPTARNQRILGKGIVRKFNDFLNPATATPAEIDAKIGPELEKIFIEAGSAGENRLIGEGLKRLEEFKPVTKLEKSKDFMSRAMVRSAQNRQIKLGKDSVKTKNIFNDMARQVLPKDMADWMTEKFIELNGNIAQQFAIVRAMHYATMQKFGLEATPSGAAFMKSEMERFGSELGIAFGQKLRVNPGLEYGMSRTGLKEEGAELLMDSNHAIHPSQLTYAVSTPNYIKIAEAAVAARNPKINMINQLTRGATSSASTAKLVNVWSLFTLFPRLGVRSAIDETFLYYLTAAPKDLLNYIGGRGALMSKIAAAATGSAAGEGVRSKFLNKLGIKSMSKLIEPERRQELIAELANKLKDGDISKLSTKQIKEIQIKEAINLVQSKKYVERLDRIYSFFGGRYKLNLDEQRWFIEALADSSQYLTSSTRSLGSAAAITGKVGQETPPMLLDQNQLAKALQDSENRFGVKAIQGVKGQVLSKEQLDRASAFNEQLPSLFHFRNFSTVFYQNAMPLETKNSITAPFIPGRVSGKTEKEYFNPVSAFFDNNAIQTGQDLYRARLRLMEQVGLRKVDENIIFGSVKTQGSRASSRAIEGGNIGKGTPMGDAKDIAMRSEADAAIVELEDVNLQKSILTKDANAIGKSSSETSLRKLGPITGSMAGKTIMLARNGKLANKSLRPETIESIRKAVNDGAKFVVGDMPNVDSQFHKLLDELGAEYTVFHTGNKPRTGIIEQKGITLGQRAQIPNMTAEITHDIADEVLLDNFLKPFVESESLLQQGISKQEVAATLINRMLIDARNVFHGSPDAFNSKLFEKIKSLKTEDISWKQAVRKLTFDDFFDATKGYRPSGEQWTDLVIEGVTDDPQNLLTKFGNAAYEIMDNQVTGLFRAPAVWIKYMQLRKSYTNLENRMVRNLQISIQQNIVESGGTVSPKRSESIKAYARMHAAKFYAERSTEEAVDTILKYVDNPNIRSNFAIASRNVGRFYRATEDFWRRMYRLKDTSIRSIYRARLTHLGLSASGSVFQDANGDEYIMMPMDDIIYKTVDRTVRAFTSGEESFKQPMFNDFTLKLSLANPSFTPDAGQPSLSGPIGALSVLGMKFIVGDVFGQRAAAQEIDNILLGNIGDNIDIQRAIIPSSFLKLYETLPKKEQSRQKATAAMQAIAYNAAFATDEDIKKYLSPTATEQDKYTYLKNIRLAAHNVVVARSILGLISPIVPTAQESKGMPDYLLDVGLTGFRPEYYDILDAVLKRFDGVIQDPYELAVATFIGKNPGKLIYTVSRENKQTQVLIRKTKELQKWALNNEETIRKYGEAAYIFAPNTGDFNASVYNWMEGAGLVERKSLEKYYMDVLVTEDKQRYYDIERQEKEQLSKTPAPDDRKVIIELATRNRALLKASNPLLEPALVAGGNEVASEVTRLSVIEQILKDSNFKIDAGSRQRLAFLTSRVRQFVNFANDSSMRNSTNFTDNKRRLKSEILDIINQLSDADPIVKEASRSTLKAILDYYSRDTYRVKA